MHQTTHPWSEMLFAVVPWVGATAALLLSFVLLTQFIEQLHVSIARGEALRATLLAPKRQAAPDSLQLASSDAQR